MRLPRLATLVLIVVLALALPAHPAGASEKRRGVSAGEPGSGPMIRALGVAVARADSGVTWSDVPRAHWARRAIDLVAGTNPWMRDFKANEDGTYPFRPDRKENRRLLARALVRAFAPDEPIDPDLTFTDLDPQTAAYRHANVVVKLGWMQAADGAFLPKLKVTPRMVHRALVLALGLEPEAAGLDRLHTKDGQVFDTPPDFGALLLGMRLGLRYNHSRESLDVGPDTPLTRAEVAWSLYRAATTPGWRLTGLASYADIELPKLGPKKRALVQFGIQYVGHPYVWGGEWDSKTPSGYCCGAQPVGGFDCSGLVWWVGKAVEGGYDNVPPRLYAGWSLPQRSSRDMARVKPRIRFADLRAGDLLFYDGNDDRTVDHVNVYIGRGWALDSSGSAAGVSILSVSSGWYRDHFVWARRIIS